MPLGPNDDVPGGIRPIPTSTQAPKKTNTQIPYVRLVFSAIRGTVQPLICDWNWRRARRSLRRRHRMVRKQTTMFIKDEGARLGHDTNSYAYARTIESINGTDSTSP